ncbi:S-layer homology domain-containing protein [Gorillibacterium timonense]|uniref:S-layer homology domain-containing protein n=1 Tax=Gorillibacterium timonense TaxID=1689269 RepID=UPI00071D6834|nr:S-layer homology domain-containing protein [Gorillibacterium timonense]
MKTSIKRKVSGLLATLLILSVMIPALAFAASIKIDNYDYNGNLNGSVYEDTYVGSTVYVTVYDSTYTHWKVVQATYDTTYKSGYRYIFNFTALESTYDPAVVKYVYGVNKATYDTMNRASYSGGGGIYVPPASGDVSIDANGKANADQLAALLQKDENAKVKFPGEFVLLPSWVLSKGKVLTVENDYGTYTLPLTKLDAEALAKKVGVALNELYIRVTIAKVSDATRADVTKAAYAEDATLLGNVIDFKVQTEATGKTAADVDFGKTYVKRTIKLDSALGKINTLASTGVLYDAAGKSIIFVPSSFAAVGDKSEVAIWRVGNSIYAPVETKKTFTDISTHWAKVDIQSLANKLVVEGYNNRFLPQSDITRAEFTAIVVRALGLTTTGAKSAGFKDVASTMWYADVINTAAQAGLVEGNGDGTFKPNAKISREEVAALVLRALAYTGKDVTVSTADKAAALKPYTDAAKVSAWAKDEVATAVKLGLIKGYTPTTIKGQLNATRAEAVTLIKRLLDTAGFTN